MAGPLAQIMKASQQDHHVQPGAESEPQSEVATDKGAGPWPHQRMATGLPSRQPEQRRAATRAEAGAPEEPSWPALGAASALRQQRLDPTAAARPATGAEQDHPRDGMQGSARKRSATRQGEPRTGGELVAGQHSRAAGGLSAATPGRPTAAEHRRGTSSRQADEPPSASQRSPKGRRRAGHAEPRPAARPGARKAPARVTSSAAQARPRRISRRAGRGRQRGPRAGGSGQGSAAG